MGLWMLLLYGDKQAPIQTECPIIQVTPCLVTSRLPLRNLTTDINEVTFTLNVLGKYLWEVRFLTSLVLQSMINQRLQKLEMIIKSHFTLNNYQKSEVLTLPFIENLKLVMHRQIIHWILRDPEHQWARNKAQWYHLETEINDYRFTKYINQNLNEAMSKDYAEATRYCQRCGW